LGFLLGDVFTKTSGYSATNIRYNYSPLPRGRRRSHWTYPDRKLPQVSVVTGERTWVLFFCLHKNSHPRVNVVIAIFGGFPQISEKKWQFSWKTNVTIIFCVKGFILSQNCRFFLHFFVKFFFPNHITLTPGCLWRFFVLPNDISCL
jgi:hypothetical protein